MVPDLDILIFHEISQFDKFEGSNFKYDNIVSKFQSKNNQIRHFWSEIRYFWVFFEIWHLGKFEFADFNYDNSFLEF